MVLSSLTIDILNQPETFPLADIQRFNSHHQSLHPLVAEDVDKITVIVAFELYPIQTRNNSKSYNLSGISDASPPPDWLPGQKADNPKVWAFHLFIILSVS